MTKRHTVNKWDEEGDVVIVGYGLAVAVAAIQASDGGAKVIILEKAQYPGGLSILSQTMVLRIGLLLESPLLTGG